MTKEDLGPMPEPQTEDPELVPGGVDAIGEDPADDNLSRDLLPEDNPADDGMPEELAEPDDKSQAPEGEAGEEVAATDEEGERTAGQEAEDGSVEPPA